jgi:TolA-binding protein
MLGVEPSSSRPPSSSLEQAISALQDGRSQDAVVHLRACLVNCPKSAQLTARYQLGMLLSRGHDKVRRTEALARFEEILALHGDSQLAQDALARAALLADGLGETVKARRYANVYRTKYPEGHWRHELRQRGLWSSSS